MSRAGMAQLPPQYWLCACGSAQRVCVACPRCGAASPGRTPDATPKRPTMRTDGPPAHDGAGGCVGQRPGKERPTVGRRTRAEAVYLASLESRLASGAVAGWLEQVTLRLPDGARYRADFLVTLADGTTEVHEVKGGHVKKHLAWSEAGVARFRAARALVPWLRFRMFVVEGGNIREENP